MRPLPFALETEDERLLVADPQLRAGLEWGKPRRGHPVVMPAEAGQS